MIETETVRTADEIAVLAVLEASSAAFFRKDFEAYSRCWLRAPYVRRLGWWTRGGVADQQGWEQLSSRVRQMMLDHPEPNRSAEELRRENLFVRVMGDMAWVTFDQYGPDTGEPEVDMPGRSREVRILERHDGQWSIVYLSYIMQTGEPARAPMFRVDRDSNVSWMNQSAEVVLRAGRAGVTVARGRLVAATGADQKKLGAAILEASDRDNALDGGRAVIPIILDPGESEAVCVCWVLTEGTGSGSVMVSLNNLTFAQDKLDAAAAVFGFSPSQQRVAELLASGKDLAGAATQLGITLNTARTHLNRIFDKVGVRGQLALVRTLLTVNRPD